MKRATTPFRLILVTVFLLPFLAALIARPGIARAADPVPDPLGPPAEWAGTDLIFRGTAPVAAIAPGGAGTLVLADGRRLRLAGITLPRRPLQIPAEQPWPIEVEAETALADLTAGQQLRLYQAGRSQDRYGRLLVQAVLEDGRWLQAVLLRRGLARVDIAPESRIPIGPLLEAESAARQAGIGLWVLPAYRVRRPAEADAWIDSVQLVEGQVRAVYRGKDGLTLAFDGNRRHAFSVHLSFAVWTEWAGMPTLREDAETPAASPKPWTSDPAALVGQRLRVRGWIGKGRTAQIEVGHAGQIEWIAKATAREYRRQKYANRRSDRN